MRGFIVAGTGSDTGKTTVTLGLMEAFRREGFDVGPFKAGPDYIDPGHHALLLGRPSYNLDTWMMGTDGALKTYRAHSKGGGIAVVEGVMGLFDGQDGTHEEGSTAHLAKVLGLPVLLVVDGAKAARSVGAMVKGFCEFDTDVDVRWVIFNRVAGEKHFKILKDALKGASKARVLGYIPRDNALAMKSRHLGLLTSSDVDKRSWRRAVKKTADYAEALVDLRPLRGRAGRKKAKDAKVKKKVSKGAGAPVVAVAHDRAFSFYYEENLDILRGLGARISFFSPLSDEALPRGTRGIYIGGGYPELHGVELGENAAMRDDIKRTALAGVPIFAECGGLMYLGKSLKDRMGRAYPMAGVFNWTTEIYDKRKALGYRDVITLPGCPFLGEGEVIRGHEFRYSEIRDKNIRAENVFKAAHPGTGRVMPSGGYVVQNVLATYIHIHFASNPAFARGFINKCKRLKTSREENR